MTNIRRALLIGLAFMISMLLTGIVIFPLAIIILIVAFWGGWVNWIILPALFGGPLLPALLTPKLIKKFTGNLHYRPRVYIILSYFWNIFGFVFFMWIENEIRTADWGWPFPW